MVSLWCLLYVIAVWAGCQLTPVVGDWVFAIPAAGCVATAGSGTSAEPTP